MWSEKNLPVFLFSWCFVYCYCLLHNWMMLTVMMSIMMICLYTVSQKTSPTFSTVAWKPIIRFW